MLVVIMVMMVMTMMAVIMEMNNDDYGDDGGDEYGGTEAASIFHDKLLHTTSQSRAVLFAPASPQTQAHPIQCNLRAGSSR